MERKTEHVGAVLPVSEKDSRAGGPNRVKRINTWLILPVVICLSQRLSHACVSTCFKIVKPRMARYNSHRLLDLSYLLG
jgi:hypothetical protein